MLNDLIKEGNELLGSKKSGNNCKESYEEWRSACVLFLEQNYKHSVLTVRFINVSEKGIGEIESALSILKGIQKVRENEEKNRNEVLNQINNLNKGF